MHTELECLSSYFLRPRGDTVCVMRLLTAAAGANQCNSNLRIREPRRVEGVSKAVHISSQEVKLYVPCLYIGVVYVVYPCQLVCVFDADTKRSRGAPASSDAPPPLPPSCESRQRSSAHSLQQQRSPAVPIITYA